MVTAHPSSTTENSGALPAGGSGQALLRHPPAPAYRCFLPDLTGFTSWRRAGPDLQRPVPRAAPDPPGLGRGFGPARADCGCRAPLAPRLARSPRSSIAVGSSSQIVGFVTITEGLYASTYSSSS